MYWRSYNLKTATQLSEIHVSPLFVSVFSDQKAQCGAEYGGGGGGGCVWLVCAHLGDLRISDLDILFAQSTQTGPMDSSTFSMGVICNLC